MLPESLVEEMRRDPIVVLFENNVAATGIFKVAAGLRREFGPDLARATPARRPLCAGETGGHRIQRTERRRGWR